MTEQLLSVGIDTGTSTPHDDRHRMGTPYDLTSSVEMNSTCGNIFDILRLTPSRAAGPVVVEVSV